MKASQESPPDFDPLPPFPATAIQPSDHGADSEPPMDWHAFVAQVGVSNVTAWRWRQAGLIEVVNIAGKPYVMRAELRRFNARLRAGEFAA